MGKHQQFEMWRSEVEPALQSKVDEFHLLGYDRVTGDEVWSCVLAKLKKRKEFTHMHQLVNTILTLRANDYMNWLTIEAYKGPNLFAGEQFLDLD